MSASIPRVKAFEQPTGSFARSVRRLNEPMKRQLANVMDELLNGTLPPGRRYEKLAGGKNQYYYSVRLSQSYRFVFMLLDTGNAKPIAVGPHDEAYRRARSSGT